MLGKICRLESLPLRGSIFKSDLSSRVIKLIQLGEVSKREREIFIYKQVCVTRVERSMVRVVNKRLTLYDLSIAKDAYWRISRVYDWFFPRIKFSIDCYIIVIVPENKLFYIVKHWDTMKLLGSFFDNSAVSYRIESNTIDGWRNKRVLYEKMCF